MDELELAWDVARTPEGTVLVTERGGRLLAHDEQGTREVAADLDDLFVGSEAGLMGLEVSPDFGAQALSSSTSTDSVLTIPPRMSMVAIYSGRRRAGPVGSGHPAPDGARSGSEVRRWTTPRPVVPG